jgi:hypothetical protein
MKGCAMPRRLATLLALVAAIAVAAIAAAARFNQVLVTDCY